MSKDIKINTDAFWQNGYLLIRDVFSEAEIEELRARVLESVPDGCGDILSESVLREVLLDDRLLNIAQKILGGKPVYFGDSCCVKGNISYGWHKDNADRRCQSPRLAKQVYPGSFWIISTGPFQAFGRFECES